jgi:tetratricopeptide (TPR) repeat protein
METLRNFLCLVILVLSPGVHAQDKFNVTEQAFEKSYSLQDKQDYSTAISTLRSVYDENSYEVNLRLGWLNYLAGMFTESASYYQKSMKLRPYAIEPKFGYVYPAAAMGNWDQVMTQYLEILSIDPQNTLANYRMGSIWYGRKEYAKAEKFLEKVINLYPFDYDSNILFAWTEYFLGKTRESQVLFHKVLLIKPKDSSALEGLSMIK